MRCFQTNGRVVLCCVVRGVARTFNEIFWADANELCAQHMQTHWNNLGKLALCLYLSMYEFLGIFRWNVISKCVLLFTLFDKKKTQEKITTNFMKSFSNRKIVLFFRGRSFVRSIVYIKCAFFVCLFATLTLTSITKKETMSNGFLKLYAI